MAGLEYYEEYRCCGSDRVEYPHLEVGFRVIGTNVKTVTGVRTVHAREGLACALCRLKSDRK